MIRKKMIQILLYENSLPKIKKDKWNGILLGEFDSHDDILNVAQCLVNIYENNLIFIHDEWIIFEYIIQMKLHKVNAHSEKNLGLNIGCITNF
jgi:hypothetical protein